MLLYIHIPFCDTKCPYCAFSSFVGKKDLQQPYTNAMIKQFNYFVNKYRDTSFDTVFIGGGTPSQLSIKYLTQIFQTISPYLHQTQEITIEANPNSATKEWLHEVKQLGITRVSFGTQSFDPAKLKFLGRKHTKNEGIQAVNNAHKVGIPNISTDFIYECAIDTPALIQNDLDIALSLPINHISAYSLTIEKNTPFAKTPQKRSNNTDLAKMLIDKINQKLPQYEISNFGTYQSKHNIGYWQHTEYIGIGNSAVGCVDNTRIYSTSDINDYIQNPLHLTYEQLSPQDINLEKIFLGFRSIIGVRADILTSHQLHKANILLHENKLTYSNNTFYNIDFLLADEISMFLGES